MSGWLLLLALLVGIVIGAPLGYAAATAQRIPARELLKGERVPERGVRHTVDHICDPPWSSWSQGYDYCWVEDPEHKHIRPGDVWVCPVCDAGWIVQRDRWTQESEAIP